VLSTRRPAPSPAFGGLIHKLTNTTFAAAALPSVIGEPR